MTIVFISNYFTIHQQPFCDEMYDKIGDNFKFIQTQKHSSERLGLGWAVMDRNYIIDISTNKKNKLIKKLIYNADVVIIGSAKDKLIYKRLLSNKLTFKYAERFYKTYDECSNIAFNFHNTIGAFIHHTIFRERNLYMLCASAYTSYDASLHKNYINKCFKWGYFPDVVNYDIDKLINNKKNEKISILWCARFLEWKHPEKALMIAKRLKQDGYNFILNMIGNGEELDKSKQFAIENNLINEVVFLGSMPSAQVRKYMDNANIFLFTSDFNEGWGAVLNESMNSACAVIASHAIGSVPFLIKDGINGLVYKNDNIDGLYEKVKLLISNPNMITELGKNAYNTMITEWNAENAVNRLFLLIESLQNGSKTSPFESGVCSKAEIIKNNWYKKV